MTRAKSQGKCPICGKVLAFLAKHLRERHAVVNKKERAILNNLTTGRLPLPPGPCPIPNCIPYLRNVERHLVTHKDLGMHRLQKERQNLKKKTAIALLSELRATNPVPNMVSSLDLEDPGEGSSTQTVDPCQNPSCVLAKQRVNQLSTEVEKLKEMVADLNKQLLVLRQIENSPDSGTSSSSSEESESESESEPEQPQEPEKPQAASSSSSEESESESEGPEQPQEPEKPQAASSSSEEESESESEGPEQQQEPEQPEQRQEPEQQQEPEQPKQPEKKKQPVKRKLPFTPHPPAEETTTLDEAPKNKRASCTPAAPQAAEESEETPDVNFETNDAEVRQNLSTFMCHSADTQERFYALHKNLARAKEMRDRFVCLAVAAEEATSAAAPTTSAPTTSAAAPTTSAPTTSAAPTSTKKEVEEEIKVS
ncbi:hypothetical protein D5F01_LYC04307 [Scomber scombrus]|uniref:Uncharacterized protein n=1 Tax=Scomber scombrus TaxID=13677 RepID=A0AAV1QH04_SCOSC